MMRLVAYQFGDADNEENSISPHFGIHSIQLKSIQTLVEGIPGKVCPVRTFTFELPQKDALLSETISLGHADVIKVHSMPLLSSSGKAAGGHKSYSPTNVSTPGEMDLTVKIYPDGTNSQAFDQLQIGDSIGVSGPWPPSQMRAHRLPGKNVHLICFGVGITEAIEVAKSELALEDAQTVNFLYANRYQEDAFFRDELAALKSQYPHRFALTYLYSREDNDTSKLQQGDRSGRVTAKVLQEVLGLPKSPEEPGHADQRFVIPGSKSMIQDTWNKYLHGFGYNRQGHSLLLKQLFKGKRELIKTMYQEQEKNKNKTTAQ